MPEITCPLHETALRYPQHRAVVGPGLEVSYEDYDRQVSRVAGALSERGVAKGSRIGILFDSSPDYLVLLMACFRVEAVACPLSTRLPVEGLAHAMETARCDFLVTHESRAVPEHVRKCSPAELRSPSPFHASAIDLDSPATIVFTSGSTGSPKAALHAYGNHYHNALASNQNIGIAPGDRWLLSLPLYHVGGLAILFRCLLAGATVVVPGAKDPVDECIVRYGVTHASLVTTQLHRLLEQRPDSLTGLKAVLLGGSGVPHGLVSSALQHGVPLHTSYGLTETASQAATTRAEDRTEENLRRATPLIPRSVSVDESGEIRVKGPTLFLGYVEGDGVHLPLTEDGWFRTGDRGSIDEHGRLQVYGRCDNMFVSGGENIHPEEVERELCRIEGVLQALVVPVPHAEYGQRPVAFLRTNRTASPEPRELDNQLSQRLPRFKLPDAYLPWPTHLDHSGMKPNRREFAAEALLQLDLSSKE